MMAVTLIVGFSLSAPVWIPVLEQLKYSNRLIVPTQISYVYLPPWYLATLVFPNLFGAPYDSRFLTLFQAVNVSHDHSLYVGIAALAMIGFCLYWFRDCVIRGRRASATPAESITGLGHQELTVNPREISFGYSRLVFFIGLFALGLLIITAAPLYVHATRFIPVLQTIRVIMRAGVLVVFAASVLAGFGCHLLLDAPREMLLRYHRFGRTAVYFMMGAVAVGLCASYAIRAAG